MRSFTSYNQIREKCLCEGTNGMENKEAVANTASLITYIDS